MSDEREPLWSDERIGIEASGATDELDGGPYAYHVISQLLVKLRNDYEARIAELEARLEGIEALKTQVTSLRQTINDLRIELSAYQAAHNRKLPPGFTRQRKNVPPWEDSHE